MRNEKFLCANSSAHFNYYAKNKGFTLSELLMSVLVISIIMVAMAPVITKRVSDNISVADVKYEGKLFTYNDFDSNCRLDLENNQTICDFQVPENIHNVNIIAVSGGGGGGSAGPFTERRNIITDGKCNGGISGKYYPKNTPYKFSMPIEANMHNFEVSIQAGGGFGGGGAYVNKGNAPTSQEDCAPLQAIFFDYDNDGRGICITRKNAGDLDILGEVELRTLGISVLHGETGASTEPFNTCFNSKTSLTCSNSASWGENSTAYSGCSRTLCARGAAEIACANYNPITSEGKETKGSWRLPNQDELTQISNIIKEETSKENAKLSKFLGSNGLDLCGIGTGSLTCNFVRSNDGLCKTTKADVVQTNCYPNYIWGAYTTAGHTSYAHYNGSLGTFSISESTHNINNSYPYFMSTRCVLDAFPEDKYVVYGGGNGTNGSFLKLYKIPEKYVSTSIGGKFQIGFSGRHGVEELNGASSGTAGTNPEYRNLAPANAALFRQIFMTEQRLNANLENYNFAYVSFSTQKNSASNLYLPVWALVLPGGENGNPATYKNGHLSTGEETNVNPDDVACFIYTRENLETATGFYTKTLSECINYFGRDKIGYTNYGSAGKMINLSLSSPLTTVYHPNEEILGERISSTVSGTSGKGSYGEYAGIGNCESLSIGTSEGGGYKLAEDEDTGELQFFSIQPEVGNMPHFVVSYSTTYINTGGFGGGGGGIYELNNISVNPNEFIEIRVGGGGAGAITGQGGNGGASGIKIRGKELNISGGNGGVMGINASFNNSNDAMSSSNNRAETIAGGILSGDEELIAIARDSIKQGETGKKSTGFNIIKNMHDVANTEIEIWSSRGGNGGSSGITNLGGCGGYSNTQHCNENIVDGESVTFQVNESVISNKNYGSAGAGGGGGAWDLEKKIRGQGGNGQPGYVYVYWAKVD